MKLYPPDAEERLGFDRLRERFLGHVRTPYGSERLRALQPSSDRQEVEERLQLASEMQAVHAAGEGLPLRGGPDVRPFLARAAPANALLEGEELAALARLLETMRTVRAFFESRQSRHAAVWSRADKLPSLEALEKHITRVVDEQGSVRDDASDALDRINRQLVSRQGKLRNTLQQALRAAASEGWAADDQPTLRGGRAVIPIRAEAKRKVPGFVHDVSATGQTVFIEPASVLDVGNEVRELEAERRREIERLLREVTGHIRAHRAEIADGLVRLGELDALAALGRLAYELDGVVPAISSEGEVRLVRARNPALAIHFVQEAARRREGGETSAEPRKVVPLDLALGDKAHTLVITGPNAGGKSVALKTVGVLALMNQCGIPVSAAPGTTLPVFTQLFVDLGDRQSIQEDLSTFTSHLQAIQQVLEQADDQSLVLIDEAGTGTDPAEGGALAEAVLRRLTLRGTRTVATTHHGTLKAFAHQTAGVENGSMTFDRETLTPMYGFKMGVPGSSYAFEVAERVGLDAPVVAEARRLAGESKVALEDLIAEMERRTQKAAAEQAEAERLRSETEKVRADFEKRLATLRTERDRLQAEALAEAERIVENANATVEGTIRSIKEAQAEREATKAAREQLEALREEVGTQQKQVARRRAPAKGSRPNHPAGPIQVGDSVRLDDGGVAGRVLEIDRKEALVAFGAMRTRASLDRLTKAGAAAPQRVEVRLPASGAAAGLPSVYASTRVDLRGQRADEAVAAVTRFVDQAVAAGVPSVEVLHGKGTGALRQAIREHLSQRPDIASFESAAWNQGGEGVTVVIIG